MAIDLTSERGISLKEAAKLIPSPRGNGPSHVSRIVRSITHGTPRPFDKVRIYLEAARYGGSWITTREAIQRYCQALAATSLREPLASPERSASARSRAAERVERELNQIGI